MWGRRSWCSRSPPKTSGRTRRLRSEPPGGWLTHKPILPVSVLISISIHGYRRKNGIRRRFRFSLADPYIQILFRFPSNINITCYISVVFFFHGKPFSVHPTDQITEKKKNKKILCIISFHTAGTPTYPRLRTLGKSENPIPSLCINSTTKKHCSGGTRKKYPSNPLDFDIISKTIVFYTLHAARLLLSKKKKRK